MKCYSDDQITDGQLCWILKFRVILNVNMKIINKLLHSNKFKM